MPKKERCVLCGRRIAKDPVPVYHAKVQNDQKKMWRHEDCPGNPHEEEIGEV